MFGGADLGRALEFSFWGAFKAVTEGWRWILHEGKSIVGSGPKRSAN